MRLRASKKWTFWQSPHGGACGDSQKHLHISPRQVVDNNEGTTFKQAKQGSVISLHSKDFNAVGIKKAANWQP